MHALNSAHSQHLPWIIFIPLIIPLGFVIASFYLMLAKPDLWLEWFINRPYRWWGLQVTVIDKERFNKVTRIYALIPFLGAFLGLLAVLTVLLTHKK